MRRWLQRLLGLVLLGVLSMHGVVNAAQERVPVADNLKIQMVDSGYTMGDQLLMQATFTVAKEQTLDPESLPLAGRVRPWLDIVQVDVSQAGQTVTVSVIFQLFATVEIAQQLSTPPLVLRTLGPQPQQFQIPAQAFYYSPVLPLPPLKDIKRRANQPPPAFDISTPMMRCLACGAVFVLLMFAWAWLNDALPWLPFNPGPMTRLARALKPIAKQHLALDHDQLTAVHHALHASAGQSLYADDLTPLFDKAPYFNAVKTPVTHFVQASWQHFYAPQKAQAIPADMVYPWVKRMAMAERLYRKPHNLRDA